MPSPLRLVAVFVALASVLALSSPVSAVPRRRVTRDRFSRTVLVGASVGVGSPRGFAGGFVELRPWRAVGLAVGGGAGGAFGPSVDVTAQVAPLGGTAWALGGEAAYSRQFSYGTDVAMPDGRTMPAHSDWISAGLSFELRPSRGFMLRVGVGRAWLLNTSDFGVFRSNELAWVERNYAVPPGVTPLDAARAANAGETLGVWYVHIDLAPAWRW